MSSTSITIHWHGLHQRGTPWMDGVAFITQHPTVSALTQPQELNTDCSSEKCGEDKICTCTYSINLQNNKAYQMVLFNMGIGKGWVHPVHMHGHSFYVVKVGLAQYDNVTGQIIGDNMDIDCGGNSERNISFCNSASWSNSLWGGNNIPGLELQSPITKDTVMVPTRGYFVLRIKADNPGVWFIHCHIELHHRNGMAMMLNESFPLHKPPPAGFPKCSIFNMDDNGITKYTHGGLSTTESALIGTLVPLLLMPFAFNVVLAYKRLKSKRNRDPGVEGSTINLGNLGYGSTTSL